MKESLQEIEKLMEQNDSYKSLIHTLKPLADKKQQLESQMKTNAAKLEEA